MPQEEQFHRIFAQIPEILMHEKILNIDESKWSIVASKKTLQTGRELDFLLKGAVGSGHGYKLIELKDVPGTQDAVDQVFDYCATLARSGEVPHSEHIEPIVLTTCKTKDSFERRCSRISNRVGRCPRLALATPGCAQVVGVKEFDAGLVLELFRNYWVDNNRYFQMKPKQVIFYLKGFGLTHKVYRLYLNKITQYLSAPDVLPISIEDLYARIVSSNELPFVFYGKGKPSIMTLRSYLAQCIVFGLARVEKLLGKWTVVSLTERGHRYIKAGCGLEEISSEQAEILVEEVLLENPFAHGAILGICLFAESVFELSKNVIPVPHSYLCPHFLMKAGTEKDWKSKRGRAEIPIHYGNVPEQLGLVRRQSEKGFRMWYMTPLGIDTVVRFQLAKAVRMLFK